MGAAKNHDDTDDGLSLFLQDLIEIEGLEDSALTVTQLVIENGISSLTSEQEQIFEKQVLDVYTIEKCTRCSNRIPWSEMMAALDNDGRCAWCQHMQEKMEAD